MVHARPRLPGLLVMIVAVVAVTFSPASAATDAFGIELRTLSNRADLVSGGDVLIELALPAGVGVDDVTLTRNGEDISGAVDLRPNGRFQGLVTGLTIGANVLEATAPGAAGARLVVTNHPVGGPVFSGEQVQPWACSTEPNGLGPAIDEQCNAPSVRQWRYRTTEGAWADYDVESPPNDVAMTTTDLGDTVPFVFLVETGAMNRGIYRFAILADPTQPMEPWSPPQGWNGSVYYKFGPACGTHYGQANPIENVEDNRGLSAGYAVATSSLSVLGTNCNTVTSAEAVMMLQEHMVELFGPIAHTRGKGGSGGSIGQHVVASGYPGLLQGLNVDMSFEDFWTTLVEVADCQLLLNYFTNTSPQLWTNPAQQAWVTGHMASSSCLTWQVSFASLLDPTTGCGAGEPYHPVDNPAGCRATVQDMQVNILGRRPAEAWTSAEQAAGFGFANFPYDNTGRLYGLEALRAGEISPEQFVDLNELIGGLDIDGTFVAARTAADPDVVEILYRGGMVASGETLGRVPIIDVRSFAGDVEIHTNFHSFAMRERLDEANGHHDNQSIWLLYEVPNLPSIAGPESFAEMGEWLRAIDGDMSDDPIADKVVRNRPDGAEDSCLLQDQRYSGHEMCAAFQYNGSPLIASGGPPSNDVLKCTLSSLPEAWPSDGSYGPVPFTPTVGPIAGQWDRLRASFPDGVCDWSRPGVGQVSVEPWTTFAAGPGGRPLGAAPSFTPLPAGRDTDLPETGAGANAAVALLGLAAMLGPRLRRPTRPR